MDNNKQITSNNNISNTQSILNIKLTNKQRKLLDVLSSIDIKSLTVYERCKRAGLSHQYYYDCFKNPNFLS